MTRKERLQVYPKKIDLQPFICSRFLVVDFFGFCRMSSSVFCPFMRAKSTFPERGRQEIRLKEQIIVGAISGRPHEKFV